MIPENQTDTIISVFSFIAGMVIFLVLSNLEGDWTLYTYNTASPDTGHLADAVPNIKSKDKCLDIALDKTPSYGSYECAFKCEYKEDFMEAICDKVCTQSGCRD